MADGIFKGCVSSVEGGAARVVPLDGGGAVTRPLPLHWSMRADGSAPVEPGDEVVCAVFPDRTGVVLCRADGGR